MSKKVLYGEHQFKEAPTFDDPSGTRANLGIEAILPDTVYGSVQWVTNPPVGAPQGFYIEDSNVSGDWYPLIGSSALGSFALGGDTTVGPVTL